MAQVAKRYAKAIFQIVKEHGYNHHQYLKNFEALEELFSIPEASKILNSPVMPAELKLEILNYGLSTVEIQPMVKETIAYLVQNRREGTIPKMVASFRSIIDESEGIARGNVTTSVEITEEEKETLSRTLGTIIGKKVILESQVNADILGGFVAQVGQCLVDQSLRTKLDDMGQFVTKRAINS